MVANFLRGRGFAEGLNIVVIAATCAAAHVWPYHVLVLSYAILGPAHYLTQISWLHDKRYFAKGSSTGLVLAAAAFAYVACASYEQATGVLVAALTFAGFLAWTNDATRLAAGAALAAALGWAASQGGPGLVAAAMLVPTIGHVFGFTASFVLAGALKSGDRRAWAGLACMLAAAATFLVPGGHAAEPRLAGIAIFQPLVDSLKAMVPEPYGSRMFGLVGFAYAYHYLNWFTKAEVIKWNRMSGRRLTMIVAAYLAFEAAYLVSFETGFFAVLLLGLAHVLLEFPLNLRTFALIGTAAAANFRPTSR